MQGSVIPLLPTRPAAKAKLSCRTHQAQHFSLPLAAMRVVGGLKLSAPT